MMNFISLFITIFITGTVAYPMCTALRYRPLMWNPAGTSAVILKQGFGSEGGGSIDLILTHSKSESIRAAITSTMSPGDGSTPEGVTPKTCTKDVNSLNHNLGVHNFQNNLHESTCKPERSYLFNRKLDAITAVDEKIKVELLKQISYKDEALVYSLNQINFIVVKSASSCTADCFWVSFDGTKNVYQKKEACLVTL